MDHIKNLGFVYLLGSTIRLVPVVSVYVKTRRNISRDRILGKVNRRFWAICRKTLLEVISYLLNHIWCTFSIGKDLKLVFVQAINLVVC